jgi:transposase InsO family protein
MAAASWQLLNEMLFNSLSYAREALATWTGNYNTVRSHSALAICRQLTMCRAAFRNATGLSDGSDAARK